MIFLLSHNNRKCPAQLFHYALENYNFTILHMLETPHNSAEKQKS